MRKIAKQLDAEADLCLPDLPDRSPGMRWSRYNRLVDRFEYQNTIWLSSCPACGVVQGIDTKIKKNSAMLAAAAPIGFLN